MNSRQRAVPTQKNKNLKRRAVELEQYMAPWKLRSVVGNKQRFDITELEQSNIMVAVAMLLKGKQKVNIWLGSIFQERVCGVARVHLVTRALLSS